MLLASGMLHHFVTCYGQVVDDGQGGVLVDRVALEALGVEPGDNVLMVAR